MLGDWYDTPSEDDEDRRGGPQPARNPHTPLHPVAAPRRVLRGSAQGFRYRKPGGIFFESSIRVLKEEEEDRRSRQEG